MKKSVLGIDWGMLHKFHMYTEQNRKILIIKSESADLSVAETFIVKREWTVHSCTNLNESILIIVQEKPQFIFVSVDHSNKNIIAFIRLLLRTFPERVIVFGERPHPLTYVHFNETGCRYNIFPPVTGPAMERVLLSYYKNQLSSSPPPQLIQPGMQFNKLQKNEAWVYKGAKPKTTSDMTLSASEASEMFSVINDKPLGKIKTRATEANEKETAKASTPVQAHETPNDASKESDFGKVTLAASAVPHESLISRATQEALQKTVKQSPKLPIEQIKISSDISCIIIQSTRFSGYLIAALGDNREVDKGFMAALRQRVFSFLKENGEIINESDEPLRLTVKKVNFKNWANQKAEFLRRSVHNQEEVSIAFFPRQYIRLNFDDSLDEHMAKVKMTELKADVPVECDLYIHLAENNKYIRYTKKGSKFLSAQKERLESQGLKFMHIFKTDLPEFNKYRAQNFLNETIDHYQSMIEA